MHYDQFQRAGLLNTDAADLSEYMFKRQPEARAYCYSRTCIGIKSRSNYIRIRVYKPDARKDAKLCPDCSSALFWAPN